MTKDAVIEAALALPYEDREDVYLRIVDSLHPPGDGTANSDEAWIAEINRRAEAARSGAEPGIPSEVVHAEMEKLLGQSGRAG